jgi:ACS family hexuronate transporter-like MFS transporter
MYYHFNDWRPCFLITAGTGLLVLIPWWFFYRQPRAHKMVNASELAYIESDVDEKKEAPIGWLQALRYKETYGFAIGKFLTDAVWWFYLTWLALYFTRVRHLSLTEIGWALPVIYLMADFGSVMGGWVSGFLIRRGWPSGKARKATMGFFALCMPVAATSVAVGQVWLAVALISLATSAHQGWSANLFTTVSDVFPKSAVASVIGIGGFMGGMGGVIFTGLLPGFVISRMGYFPIFVLMGSLHPIAWLVVHYTMGRIEKIKQPHAIG